MARESLAKKFDKADKRLKRISGTIGAVIAIIGAATGICTWVSNQFQSMVSTQISELQEEVKYTDTRQEQSLTRLELIMLMKHDPENRAEIEKMAKYYFVVLDGDWYMTGLYSQWAEKYDGDISFIITKE